MYFYFGLLILTIGYAEAATCTGDRPIKPVCGSDGSMYLNECNMKDETYGYSPVPVYPVAWEQCDDTNCNQICDRNYDPVCGSDGEILGNPCAFLWYHVCANRKYVYEVNMNFCLTKKCTHDCAPNDESCYQEWKKCRSRWTSIGK